MLVGGGFAEFNGTPRNGIVRLNGDGTTDMSFDPGSGANEGVRTILEQPDGQVLIGGTFDVQREPHRHLVRLSASERWRGSSVRDRFRLPRSAAGHWLQCGGVWDLAFERWKILVGGTFTEYNGVTRGSLAQLLPDGTLDPSFAVGQGFRDCGYVYAFFLLPNEQRDRRGLLDHIQLGGCGQHRAVEHRCEPGSFIQPGNRIERRGERTCVAARRQGTGGG
ncbi:MAG: delta-60 repeat domain-containing protein [Flavobacteriales bacterium]|nr:delta-60 repeat domain-containing protein [Flavobacteriales bacterium]